MTVPFGVQADATTLPGDLTLPADARGVVAHGSGSSRHSPRNMIAELAPDWFATHLTAR